MKINNVEDIYALSSLQQLMLLQSLSSNNGKGMIEHLKFTVKGAITTDNLASAWSYVAHRHAALRTSFYWRKLSHPVQVVRRNVAADLVCHDYRKDDKPADELIELYVNNEWERGVRLDQAPLVRMAAFVRSAEEHVLLLSYHSIVLDGWSLATVLRDFFSQLMQVDVADTGSSKPPVFRDYIAWLRQRDIQGAENWWRACLNGFNRKTPLWVNRGFSDSFAGKGQCTVEKRLSVADKDTLVGFARKEHTTLNMIVQLAWALLLIRYADEKDIVFGVAVSGRPPELPGVEEMVGTFINNVPVRVCIKADDSIRSMLSDLSINMLDLKEHEHVSPSQIQQWSDMASSDRLFESLVLFQNFPLEGAFSDSGRNFTVCNVDKDIKTNFPLTLVCIPQPDLDLQLIIDGRYFDEPLASKMLDDCVSLLLGIVRNPDASIQSVLSTIERPVQGELSRFVADQQKIRRQNNSNVAPLTATEKKIAIIWQDVLGLDPVNSADNFFELGGRSIQVMAVHARLCDLGYDTLPVVDLFEYPTISQLALRLNVNESRGMSDDNYAQERMQKRGGRVSGRRERMKNIREGQE